MDLNAWLRTLFGGVCGLVSGLILAPAINRFLLVGFIFGVALSAYFVGVQRRREPFLLISFIAMCTTAYPIAYFSAYALTFVLGAAQGGESISPIGALVAGYVGAFLVLGAGLALFCTLDVGKQLFKKAAIWSLAGGVLGVLGTIRYDMRWEGRVDSHILFPVWQGGTGMILAGFVERFSTKTRAGATD
jgi:hypothetical protein